MLRKKLYSLVCIYKGEKQYFGNSLKNYKTCWIKEKEFKNSENYMLLTFDSPEDVEKVIKELRQSVKKSEKKTTYFFPEKIFSTKFPLTLKGLNKKELAKIINLGEAKVRSFAYSFVPKN